MKILLLIDNLCSGGAETHVELLARELSALGHKVCVASAGGEIADKLSRMGIELLHLPFPKNNKKLNTLTAFFHCFLAQKLLSDYIHHHSPKIIHAHTRKMAFLAHGICKREKIPLIVTAHSKSSMKFPKNILSKWGDGTIAVSLDIKKHLISHGTPADQIKVINNGVCLPPHPSLKQGEKKGEEV